MWHIEAFPNSILCSTSVEISPLVCHMQRMKGAVSYYSSACCCLSVLLSLSDAAGEGGTWALGDSKAIKRLINVQRNMIVVMVIRGKMSPASSNAQCDVIRGFDGVTVMKKNYIRNCFSIPLKLGIKKGGDRIGG